jgi:hypothetical protein
VSKARKVKKVVRLQIFHKISPYVLLSRLWIFEMLNFFK